ncbi:hypothetical protein FRC19_008620 [Serendipita sp. 401]|nr:hypothetical protein FRC19_008620 [Serendipita sp. 401]
MRITLISTFACLALLVSAAPLPGVSNDRFAAVVVPETAPPTVVRDMKGDGSEHEQKEEEKVPIVARTVTLQARSNVGCSRRGDCDRRYS